MLWVGDANRTFAQMLFNGRGAMLWSADFAVTEARVAPAAVAKDADLCLGPTNVADVDARQGVVRPRQVLPAWYTRGPVSIMGRSYRQRIDRVPVAPFACMDGGDGALEYRIAVPRADERRAGKAREPRAHRLMPDDVLASPLFANDDVFGWPDAIRAFLLVAEIADGNRGVKCVGKRPTIPREDCVFSECESTRLVRIANDGWH
jgi:hypothetical protein